MIYVISATGTEFVKIGKAKNPVSRLKTLQTGIPMTLAILAVADWNDEYEGRLHGLLRQFHVRGEWYRSCDNISSLIKHMQSGAYDPIAWIDRLYSTSAASRRLARVLSIAR